METSQVIQNFNKQIMSYFISSTYGNEDAVLNSLILISRLDTSLLSPENLDNSIFYKNLYKLFFHTKTASNILFAAIKAIENCAQCPSNRDIILIDFHILDVLCDVLLNVQLDDDQVVTSLQSLRNMSYSIKLKKEENCIEFLVQYLLKNFVGRENDEKAKVSLAVLTNICYKNPGPTDLLIRNIKMDQLEQSLKPFGFLSCKIFIILDCINCMSKEDLLIAFDFCITELKEALNDQNVNRIRHCIEILKDIKSTNVKFKPEVLMLQSTLENILNNDLNDSKVVSDNPKLAKCVAVIFEMFSFALKHEPSLETIYQKIVESAIRWVFTKESCAKAMDLIRDVYECVSQKSNLNIDDYFKRFKEKFQDILECIENNGMPSEEIVALSKLMVAMVKGGASSGVSQFILSNLKDVYFEKIFKDVEQCHISSLDSKIKIYVYSLYVIFEFEHAAPQIWFAKLDNLMKMSQIHYILSKSLDPSDLELRTVALKLSSFVNFPYYEVEACNVCVSMDESVKTVSNVHEHPLEMPKSETFGIYRRLNRIQEQISKNKVKETEFIDFLKMQNDWLARENESLTKKLNHAVNQNAELSQDNAFLKAMNKKHTNYNIDFNLKLSKEKKALQMSTQEVTTLKDVVQKYEKKLDEARTKMNEISQKLTILKTENDAYVKQIKKMKLAEGENSSKIENLEKAHTELRDKINEYKKVLRNSEEEKTKLSAEFSSKTVKSEKIIIEREREISKLNDKVVKQEGILNERNQKIKSLEAELKESESIKETVLNLFNKKR